MWIHIPTTSAFTPEPVDLTLDSSWPFQVLEQSVTWKETRRQARSWLTTCKRNNWMMRLCGQIPQPSTASRGLEAWISSSVASPVSRGVPLESEKEQTTNDGSGLTSSDWFARYDQTESSWKTSQASFLEELNTYSEIWPQSGTMRNGQVFEQVTLERHTDERGSLSWPSPVAADSAQGDIENENTKYITLKSGRLRKLSNNGESGSLGLAREVKHWSTPEARDHKGHTITANHPTGFNKVLPNDVAMWMSPAVMSANDKFKNMPTDLSRLSSQGVAWSTPLASDDGHKVTVNSGQAGLIGDADRFHGRPIQTALSGDESLKQDPTLPRLNPKMVEWLMGWPVDWLELTAFASSETE
jgi:hypothetical protein